jgi:hypothetical protein
MEDKEEIDPDNLPNFHIPEKFLDQLYDFTGGPEFGNGFLLSYVDDQGRAMVFSRTSSQIVEMGLRKALEKYLSQIEDIESTLDMTEDAEE